MEVNIISCNNIDHAKILIEENKLNIKYAMNGTGKSTIARAIELFIEGKGNLKTLLPFKYLEQDPKTIIHPAVSGVENLKSVCVFNENYINQFVFKQDEVLKNSFEIFIKNEEYNKQMEEIDKAMSEIKQEFVKNENLNQIIQDLAELGDCFGNSKDGYHASGTIGKGIAKGNKIENIPEGLEIYADYLKSNVNIKWIKWQMDGNSYVDISTSCPYCTSPTTDKKEKIKSVSKEYDSKYIEHLNRLIRVLDQLGKYFSEESLLKFTELTKNKIEIPEEGKLFLKNIKGQVDILKSKMIALQNMTFFSFKDANKVIEKIKDLKIDIKYLSDLKSTETLKIVDALNSSLDAVAIKAGVLQAEVGKQRTRIERAIKEHKDEINSFLKHAGYRYIVDIEADGDSYKMKLMHEDVSSHISGANERLSYGERNAFSIVLFMYECISRNPDLVVLDDPISSFDKNKKFAIISTLFGQRKSLKGKTVLMLTHDLEPVVDMVYSLRAKFGPHTVASYLETKGGVISETPINKDDISSFTKICDDIVGSAHDEIVKLIHLRRFHEVLNDKGMAYQLLSNIIHKREVPTLMPDDRPMSASEINEATKEIESKIPGFNYKKTISLVSNETEMLAAFSNAKHNYAKLQIFRIIKGEKVHDSDIIGKYIKESFHIENDYIMQLNPSKYEMIPHFIITECSKSLFGN